MNFLKDLIKELKEKGKENKITKGILIAKEQAIFKDLMSEIGKCKCERTENLTLDHIIPLDILRSFGIDVEREIIEDNYQLLCKLCNHFKGNRLDFFNPKTKEILLKLLNKL